MTWTIFVPTPYVYIKGIFNLRRLIKKNPRYLLLSCLLIWAYFLF